MMAAFRDALQAPLRTHEIDDIALLHRLETTPAPLCIEPHCGVGAVTETAAESVERLRS